MTSFDSELSALIAEWLQRGETPQGIAQALAVELKKVGGAPAHEAEEDAAGVSE